MVYIVHALSTDLYKIGYGIDAEKRIKGLQTGCPHDLAIVKIYKDYEVKDEQKLHAIYAEYRVRGEWFSFTREEVKRFFNEKYEPKGVKYSHKEIEEKKYELRRIQHERIESEKRLEENIKNISMLEKGESIKIILNNKDLFVFVFYLCVYIVNNGKDGDAFDNDIHFYMQSEYYYYFMKRQRFANKKLSHNLIKYVLMSSKLVVIEDMEMYFDSIRCEDFINNNRRLLK